ncbi:hypothetical protein JG688_00007512 [Phytophthora aleatoria]|uniref:Laminin IV type A domain-containing protein n=1 Tax=Phytophthora aleatoria TaxID=2496075 RepID=A0A8J5M810_9STRA|nr:hypothetical protein JG688_00007512 [Phytophthora aleatoria]
MRRSSLRAALLLLLYLCLPLVVHADTTSASVAPASLNAGVVNDVAVTFTSGVDVEVGGSVLIEFPTGFHISSGTTVSVTTTGSTTTLSVTSVSSPQLSVLVGTTKISAGVAFGFFVTDVTNPAAQTTSDFLVSTYDSSNALLERNTAISGITIVSTTLSGAAVAPDSLNAGATGTATVAFTSAVRLPVGSKVEVSFPSDFMVASSTLSSVTNIDSSSTVTTSSSVVTVTIAGSAVSAGSSVSFKLDGVTNPGAKTTGTFAVATTDSSSKIFQQATAISAATIVNTVLSGVSVGVDNDIAVAIDQETVVTIALTDILSPESIRPEQLAKLGIQSHLGGDVNTGSIRMNAINKGALTGPLTWQPQVLSPGPVAGLRTSSNLAFKTTGQVAAGGSILVEFPFEWVMSSTCKATFVHPPVLGRVSCSQNNISILMVDDLVEAMDVNISFTGVYNPPLVMSEGVASCRTIAPDGGVIDESNAITTGAIAAAVTGITNSGDHLTAVVGLTKIFVFEGSALAESDVVKFVDASTTSDANCGESTTGQSDVGGVSVKLLSANLDISVKFTQSSQDGKPFAICYKFGDNPFKLYSTLSIMVKEIKFVSSNVGFPDIAVANFVKTWTFNGNGISAGDQMRWIDLDVAQSAACISTPPDCLDTSTLAKLASPTSGTLTTPEDDYTRVIQKNSNVSFAFSVESSGKTFCLCYKFGKEPFMVYPAIKMQVNHLKKLETTSTGNNAVAVVDAPKSFKFLGDGVALNDRLYFVELGSVLSCEESDNDVSLRLLHWIADQEQSVVFIDGNLITTVNFDATAAGMMVAPCYQFGMEPYQLYQNIRLPVKMVKRYTGTLGSPQLAVADVAEPLTFLGNGLSGGDLVRWILNGEEDCGSDLASLTDPSTLELVDTITLDNNNAALFNFTSTQSDFNPVLCYKFGEENFKLYSDISIAIGMIRAKSPQTGVKEIAVAAGDRIGWTTAIDLAVPCNNLSLLIPNPLNLDNDYLSYLTSVYTFGVALSSLSSGKRVYLCYGFGQEPFKLFTGLYLDVKNGVATGDFAKFVSSNDSDCTDPGVTLVNIIKEYDDYDEMAMFFVKDTLKFVNSGTNNKDAECVDLPAQGRADQRLQVATDLTVTLPFESVKEITALLDYTFQHIAGLGGVATIGHRKQWKPVGSGIQEGDTVKIVPQSVTSSSECGKADANIATGTAIMTVGKKMVFSGTISAFPASTRDVYHLCYQFQDEPFTYIRDFTLTTFDRQPFDIFKTVTLTVAKAEIWTPQIVSIIADQTTEVVVSGTFGITQGTDQIAWVPSDVIECSTDAVALYAEVMQTSVTSVTKSQSIVPHAGEASFNARYVAPRSGSGITASDSFSIWKLCYRFGSTPDFIMFGDVLCMVLNIVEVALLSMEATSTGAVMKFQFDGVGMQDFDAAKWVDASMATSDADCNTLPAIGGSKISDVVNSRATFTFAEESSAMALCYRFLGHSFKLYANILVQDLTTSRASIGQTTASNYDEEAVAAASDQFTASRDVATVSLTLDKDISEIPPGSSAEAAFKASFIATMATSLGIDASRVQITELVAGSVVVNFQLLASDNPANPSVNEAVQDLHRQLLDTSSNLLTSSTVVVKNPTMALHVTVTSVPAPTTSSVAIQALGYQSNGLFSFVRSIYSVTEKSSKLVIPVIRLQGTSSVVSITVQVQTAGTTAVYDKDYAFPASTTVDESMKLLRLRFGIGDSLGTLELDILDNEVKEAHFKTISLALLDPSTSGTSLGSTKGTVVRIYDYGDGVPLANSSFTVSVDHPDKQRDLLQGWQVVANGESPVRVDGNGIFAVDDVLGEAEYNQKCDLAAPTGVCTYACELGGGLTSSGGLESSYNVLSLSGDDYAASMNGVSAFPSEAFTVSLWVKTTQSDPNACLYSYAVSSVTAPAVPLALCNPSNLQLFINAESDVSGLKTFVNISDNAWHFLAVTWSSEDGRVRVFDNGMLAFDGGPYRGGKTLESNGFFVAGQLVLSSASKTPCTVGAEALSQSYTATSTSGALFVATTEDVSCDVAPNGGFKGQIQHVHGRVVNDLSTQGHSQKNLGALHCSKHSTFQLTSIPASNTANTSTSYSCLLRGEVPRLDATFPCGPVFSNIWHFSAPATFVSTLKTAYGGRLQYRLLAPSFNGSPRPRRGQVSIFSTNSDGVLTQISAALGSFDLPSASHWTYYSVVLREDFGWITEPDGDTLTAAKFGAVLEGATALWIRGDIWGYDSTGPGQEVVYLNDVALYAR